MARHSVSWGCLCGLMAGVLSGCPPASRPVAVDPYVDARAALRQAAEDPDARVRTHAMEALAVTEGQAAGGVMLQGLRDDRLPVVSAAAMAAGETRYAQALPVLLELAKSRGTPPKLRCVVIYALHRLGNDTYTGELATLLRHSDKFVRAEAARVMGRMGEPSATELLKTAQRDDLEAAVRLNIAEALALLGDERSLALLEAFTKSQFVDDRLLAVEALGRLGHPRSVYVLTRLMKSGKHGPLVRVAAAASLAQLGGSVPTKLVTGAVQDPEGMLRKAGRGNPTNREVTSLQVHAVMAMGRIGDASSVDMLHPLLRSRRGPVRVAAARAILRLLPGPRVPAATTAPAGKAPAAPTQPEPKPQPPKPEVKTAPAKPAPAPPKPESETQPAAKTEPVQPAAPAKPKRPALRTSGAKD